MRSKLTKSFSLSAVAFLVVSAPRSLAQVENIVPQGNSSNTSNSKGAGSLGNSLNNNSGNPSKDAIKNGGQAVSVPLSERVSLEYRNAPLVDVLRSIADAAKFNLALASAVSNSNPEVTIRLTNVTYDVALRTILDLQGLGVSVEDGVLRVDTVDNITKQRQQKVASKLDIWKSEPTRRLVWQVNYAKANDLQSVLKTMLQDFAQDARFSIVADPRTNKLMVEGVADALIKAKSILESLDKRKQQVLIEARIVEASNELSRTLSVTWGTRFGFDGRNGLPSGIAFPNSIQGSLGGAGSVGQAAPSAPSNLIPSFGQMGLSLGAINGMLNIDGILRAYETEQLANIIATPRIVVEDNEKASIDETTSTTRPVPGGAGETRTLEVGLNLTVTPQITSDNSIELDIEVKRETPTNAATDSVQGKTSRKAKTKLIVNNGDTAVIGGLYQTFKLKGTGVIPFLGRLPIIGFLFRTNDEQSRRTELMVLITPRILPSGSKASDYGATSSSGVSASDFGNGTSTGSGNASTAKFAAGGNGSNSKTSTENSGNSSNGSSNESAVPPLSQNNSSSQTPATSETNGSLSEPANGTNGNSSNVNF